jgi:Uma2 family endonuclease
LSLVLNFPKNFIKIIFFRSIISININILSPGNSNKEMKYKFDLYEEAGVLEYWIVNPADKTVFIYILKENQFIGMHPLIEEDNIQSKLFPELDFKLESIFN